MVLFVNTILFLLATKVRQRGNAAKIYISDLRFGDPSIWFLSVRYTDMSIRMLQVSVMENLEGTALS